MIKTIMHMVLLKRGDDFWFSGVDLHFAHIGEFRLHFFALKVVTMALANELDFEIPLNTHNNQPRAVAHASGIAGADGMTAMMPDREGRMPTLMGSAVRADMLVRPGSVSRLEARQFHEFTTVCVVNSWGIAGNVSMRGARHRPRACRSIRTGTAWRQ